MSEVKLPEPFLYAHELIENEDVGQSGGIWLGVNKEGICEEAHIEGETGDVVIKLFTAEQLEEYAEQRVREALDHLYQYGREETHKILECDDDGLALSVCTNFEMEVICAKHKFAGL